MSTFDARYRSVCGACEEWIQPGQSARYAEDVVVHDDCHRTASAQWRGAPCATCFQIPSANGLCGCEDLSPEWTI